MKNTNLAIRCVKSTCMFSYFLPSASCLHTNECYLWMVYIYTKYPQTITSTSHTSDHRVRVVFFCYLWKLEETFLSDDFL